MGTVDLRAHFHLDAADMDIAVDHGGALEGKRILDEDVSVHLAPEINRRTEELAGKAGGLAHHHLAVGVKRSVHLAVHTDVGERTHITPDGSALGDTADIVYILFHCPDRFAVQIEIHGYAD